MSTPHNSAEKGEFAKTVLMPGDPLRAKFTAETFLTGARLVNNVRGIGGYTGTYKNRPVSVMASGMGMPSMGIYSYELFHFYDVDNIIRIGSAGAIREDVKIRDLVLGIGACTNSNYAGQYGLRGTFAPTASWKLLSEAVRAAEKLGVRYHVGNLLSSDTFYSDNAEEANEGWRRMGVMAIEMEAAALYMNAARAGKNALAVCTVSDHLITGEATSAEERQTSFTAMMEVALETAAALDPGTADPGKGGGA
jgi:purine-nucleoside phosphorylase